jgi:hypothetical protein
MNHDLSAAAFFAESLRLTLKQTAGLDPAHALRAAFKSRVPAVAAPGRSVSPFKRRDPLTQRKLLLAS